MLAALRAVGDALKALQRGERLGFDAEGALASAGWDLADGLPSFGEKEEEDLAWLNEKPGVYDVVLPSLARKATLTGPDASAAAAAAAQAGEIAVVRPGGGGGGGPVSVEALEQAIGVAAEQEQQQEEEEEEDDDEADAGMLPGTPAPVRRKLEFSFDVGL